MAFEPVRLSAFSSKGWLRVYWWQRFQVRKVPREIMAVPSGRTVLLLDLSGKLPIWDQPTGHALHLRFHIQSLITERLPSAIIRHNRWRDSTRGEGAVLWNWIRVPMKKKRQIRLYPIRLLQRQKAHCYWSLEGYIWKEGIKGRVLKMSWDNLDHSSIGIQS